MTSNVIVPFGQSQLPDYIKQSGNNNDLASYASSPNFTQLSIKGKKFTVVRGSGKNKTYTLLHNPKDPESPATYVEVAVIKVHPHKSKAFYEDGFKEGADATRPDCSSTDGDKPDPGVPSPQSTNCITCRHNEWGSKIGTEGHKGKACQDNVRIVVAPLDNVNDLMFMRVPPTSIKNIGLFGKACDQRNVPYNMVGTKISFDPAATSPLLVFTPIGLVNQVTAERINAVLETDMPSNIITGKGFPAYEGPVPAPKLEVVQPIKPTKTVIEGLEDLDIDLDNLNFDD